MTAPDMESVIAKALFSHEQCDRRQKLDLESNWMGRLSERDREEYLGLARAVLASISEAGAVEWGVEREFTEGPEVRKMETRAACDDYLKFTTFKSRIVSRLTGPWTEVKPGLGKLVP